MPQITNLNVAPYYDDFDKEDNFHRVLFRPGFAIQGRELTLYNQYYKIKLKDLVDICSKRDLLSSQAKYHFLQ